jgi:hypothetical protein
MEQLSAKESFSDNIFVWHLGPLDIPDVESVVKEKYLLDDRPYVLSSISMYTE